MEDGLRNTRYRMRYGFIGCLLLALGATAQEPGMEISGFRVPEYDEQGQMTSQIFGKHAEIGKGGVVKITELRIEFYKGGKTAMTVTAPTCFYNQRERTARSEDPITADMEKVHLRGRGFFLNASNSTVRVLNDCKVTIEDIMEQAAVEGKTRTPDEVTEIFSDELFLDYNGRSVLFDQNVHVQDPELTLDAGTLEVRFSEKNEIDWIEAQTDVRIVHEGREARAGKAVYDVTTDEFVLEQSPRIVDGRNTLYGDTIRFWRASRKMVCEPAARLVIYPNGDLKNDLFEKK